MVIDVPAFNAEEWPDLSRGTQGTVASADTRCDVVVNLTTSDIESIVMIS